MEWIWPVVEVWRGWFGNDVFGDDTDGMAVLNCGGEKWNEDNVGDFASCGSLERVCLREVMKKRHIRADGTQVILRGLGGCGSLERAYSQKTS
jgi:hypothetical protein